MYRVKVVGDYIARSGVMDKEKVKKSYEIEGNIPTLNAALSIVKNKLLAPALGLKYPDYVTFLTYHIVEIMPLTEDAKEKMSKAEVSFMNRPTLLKFIKDNALPVDARYYPNLFRLREAVMLAKEDAEGYKRQFALREPDLRLDLEMAECNPELYKDPQAEAPLAASVTNLPAPKLKASNTKTLVKKTGDRLSGLAADQVRDGEMGPMDSPEAGDL